MCKKFFIALLMPIFINGAAISLEKPKTKEKAKEKVEGNLSEHDDSEETSTELIKLNLDNSAFKDNLANPVLSPKSAQRVLNHPAPSAPSMTELYNFDNLKIDKQGVQHNVETAFANVYPVLKPDDMSSAEGTKVIVSQNPAQSMLSHKESEDLPLHLAASHGNDELVKALIQANANVNSRDKNKLTPLHMAARGSNLTTVDELLLLKADVNAKDNRSLKPFDYVRYGIVQSNRDNYPGYVNRTKLTQRHGNFLIAKLLLDHKADLGFEGKKKYYIDQLAEASCNGRIDAVQDAIKNGADVNCVHENGMPFIFAAIVNSTNGRWKGLGYPAVIREMLAAGANLHLNVRNEGPFRNAITFAERHDSAQGQSPMRDNLSKMLLDCYKGAEGLNIYLSTPFNELKLNNIIKIITEYTSINFKDKDKIAGNCCLVMLR